MSLKRTIDVLNRMEADGVIGRYCISGAFAAYYYVEPTATEDLHILVSFEKITDQAGLLTIAPVVSYLGGLGYSEFRKEGTVVEGWPVQFLLVADDLDAEALASSQEVVVRLKDGAVRTRMLKPEHIVATALRTGRPKDRVRVVEFLEGGVVDQDSLCSLLKRHDLTRALDALCRTAGLA